MYEFRYGYVKSKYCEKNKIILYEFKQFHCIHKTQMIIIKILQKMFKLDLIYSNYELDRPLPELKEKIKKHLH